ncbi:MAG: HEPN domain-containing protein [Pseudomonadota bacterium]
MEKKDVLKYWVMSSDHDFNAMTHLFDKGDYTWSLFIGHLVIEKLLKAMYVYQVDITPPFIHDLVRLAEKSKIYLTEDQRDFLDTVSTFNLQARYDDYKMAFHRKCSQAFAEKWIDQIKEFREWIKNKLPKQP